MDAAAIITALGKLAWPLVVAMILLLYKSELTGAVTAVVTRVRDVKVGAWGISAEAHIAQEQQKSEMVTTKSVVGSVTLKDVPGLSRTKAISALELKLHDQLNGLSDTQDRLINALAEAQLAASFGVTYAFIFGSQIAGLKELSVRRRATVAEAVTFFSEAERLNPKFYEGYGFAGWLNFLKARNLVAQTGNNQEFVEITDIGDDFVLWLERSKLPTNRPG